MIRYLRERPCEVIQEKSLQIHQTMEEVSLAGEKLALVTLYGISSTIQNIHV